MINVLSLYLLILNFYLGLLINRFFFFENFYIILKKSSQFSFNPFFLKYGVS